MGTACGPSFSQWNILTGVTGQLPKRDPKSDPRPMGAPRELLSFLTSEVYRYRQAMNELLSGLDQLVHELRQKPDTDFFARLTDSNLIEKWRVLTQTQLVFVALRGILSMAEAIRTVSGNGAFPSVHAIVCSTIATFEKEAPYAKDMRDLLIHLDAYLLGIGHKELPRPQDRLWLATPEGDLALYIGGIALSVRRSVDSADALAEGVRTAIQDLENSERSAAEKR